MAATKQHSYCRVCQALCGTIVTVDDGRIVRIQGDPDNAASRGYTCAKGRAAGQLHHDPQGLTEPLVRRQAELEPVSWDDFVEDAGGALARIVDDHGPQSIAIYRATHYYYDAVGGTLANSLIAALGTPQVYSPQTIDMVAKVVVPELMLGSPATLELPDWEATRLLLLFGENIVVSHGHSTAASDPVRRLRAIQARGGHVVSIDPRTTPTTRLSDLHIAPRPGTDAAILACLLREVLRRGRDDAYLEGVVDHADCVHLAELLEDWSIEHASAVADVPADQLRRLTDLVLAAGRISFHCGTGITMAQAANVVEWLGYALTIVTGSLDRPGGTIFTPGMLFPREQARTPMPSGGPGPASRPDVHYRGGEYPCSVLADEILAGHVKALVVVGGNPMRLFPDSKLLEQALGQLDVLLCFDVRHTETTQFATHVAAVADPFERWDMPIPNDRIFPIPYTMVTAPLVPLSGVRRTMGWVISRIAERLGLTLTTTPAVDDVMNLAGVDDEAVLRGLAAFARPTWEEIRSAQSGVTACDAPPPGWFVPALLPERGITLVPTALAEQWREIEVEMSSSTPPDLLLINTRLPQMSNSVPTARAAYELTMNPADAAARDLVDGDRVVIATAVGSIESSLCVSDEIRPGAVGLPPGGNEVNINALTSARDVDPLTGMPRFTAIEVHVRRATSAG